MKAVLLLASAAAAAPFQLPFRLPFQNSIKPKEPSKQTPVVVWHGLGDRFDNPGLQDLTSMLDETFVHIVRLAEDGAADQRASFFGNAFEQIDQVCDQLRAMHELDDGFHLIGLSQGGPLGRAAFERCRLPVRKLITLGSPHMGISALPPCPPGSGPLSPCKLMQIGLVTRGISSTWAQTHVVPAQYYRDPAKLDEYLEAQSFLADVNNERLDPAQANATYKETMLGLDAFVMFRFTEDATVVPPHSAHFRLPPPNATCPSPPVPPTCYDEPVRDEDMPLYRDDLIGLRKLDQKGKIIRDTCTGPHMYIDEDCWQRVRSHLD